MRGALAVAMLVSLVLVPGAAWAQARGGDLPLRNLRRGHRQQKQMTSSRAALLLQRLEQSAQAAASPAVQAAAQASAAANPVTDGAVLPPWQRIGPSDFLPAAEQLEAEEAPALTMLSRELARVRHLGLEPNYTLAMSQYTQTALRQQRVYNTISLFGDVLGSEPGVQAGLDAAQPKLEDVGDSAYAAVWDTLLQLAGNSTLQGRLGPEQRRVVSLLTAGSTAESSNVTLEAELWDRLSELGRQFGRNADKSQASYSWLLRRQFEAAGLDATTLALAAANARAAGHASATPAAGPWLLRLDGPTYDAVVTYARDRELRRRVYTAFRSFGTPANDAVVREILQVRRRLANLLGFPDWAQYKFSGGRMASLDQAMDFMRLLAEAAAPAARREHKRLTAFARRAAGNASLELEAFDVAFYANLQSQELFSQETQAISEYLPLDAVLGGLFELCERLFGVKFAPAGDDVQLWHPDVRAFTVSNASDPSAPPLAYYYVDAFTRPGQKSEGAWENSVMPGARLHLAAGPASEGGGRAGGGGLRRRQLGWLAGAPRQPAVTYNVLNQAPPVEGRPSLMTADDVWTLFHEAGHALQDMLGRSDEGLLAGIGMMEQDAVEIASQIQQRFAYNPKVLRSFARHWSTGEPMPKEMVAQVAAQATYRKGTWMAAQLLYCLTDLRLHGSFDPFDPGSSPYDVFAQAWRELMPYPMAPLGDRMLNNFDHLFAGGYDAGYYSYLWADVLAADAYAAFAEAAAGGGGGGGAAAREEAVGRRYASTVLGLGGSVPPAEAFRLFRGRDPEVGALLDYYGVRSSG